MDFAEAPQGSQTDTLNIVLDPFTVWHPIYNTNPPHQEIMAGEQRNSFNTAPFLCTYLPSLISSSSQ